MRSVRPRDGLASMVFVLLRLNWCGCADSTLTFRTCFFCFVCFFFWLGFVLRLSSDRSLPAEVSFSRWRSASRVESMIVAGLRFWLIGPARASRVYPRLIAVRFGGFDGVVTFFLFFSFLFNFLMRECIAWAPGMIDGVFRGCAMNRL